MQLSLLLDTVDKHFYCRYAHAAHRLGHPGDRRVEIINIYIVDIAIL